MRYSTRKWQETLQFSALFRPGTGQIAVAQQNSPLQSESRFASTFTSAACMAFVQLIHFIQCVYSSQYYMLCETAGTKWSWKQLKVMDLLLGFVFWVGWCLWLFFFKKKIKQKNKKQKTPQKTKQQKPNQLFSFFSTPRACQQQPSL